MVLRNIHRGAIFSSHLCDSARYHYESRCNARVGVTEKEHLGNVRRKPGSAVKARGQQLEILGKENKEESVDIMALI